MKIKLIYTPTADPTSPWDYLYILKGFFDSKTDCRITVCGLNITGLLYLFQPKWIETCWDRLNERVLQFEARNKLSTLQQLEFDAAINPHKSPDASDVTCYSLGPLKYIASANGWYWEGSSYA